MWYSDSGSASVLIRARLERRSDGALLWEHWGNGYNEGPGWSDEQADDLLEFAVNEVFDKAFGSGEPSISASERKQKMRSAARESIGNMLREFPDAPGR